MEHIHWFNPENDLALAADATNYTPPRGPRLLHDAGALLPLWYGDANDKVLCYGVNERWLDTVRLNFDISIDVFNHQPSVRQIPDPWGWSMYARKFFLEQDFSADTLPSVDKLEKMRSLSHRRTALLVARQLEEMLPQTHLEVSGSEATSIDEVEKWLRIYPKSYLKMPWSSSGRGVLESTAIAKDAVMDFASNSIRRQGSVILQPTYDKAIDFARIYYCQDGRCEDIGTSVFTTDINGSYNGNLLAPESIRVQKIGEYIDPSIFSLVADALRRILERCIAPYYSGILGVDMLVTKQGHIVPVVEINLRKTMGYVAMRFSDRYLTEGSIGQLIHCPTKAAPHLKDAIIEGHRLVSGSISLTPQNPNFSFIVNVQPQ